MSLDTAPDNLNTLPAAQNPEENRMTNAQSLPMARAVGASGPQAVEQQRSAEVLKVSTRSRPSAVAGAIAGVIRENGAAEVQSIGAGATNQAIKAVAIARSYLNEEGIDIFCVPSFIDVAIDDEERTAIRLLIERRPQ
jgi:stage V sporulation protein S